MRPVNVTGEIVVHINRTYILSCSIYVRIILVLRTFYDLRAAFGKASELSRGIK